MLWAEMSACKSAQSRPYSRRGRLLLSGLVEGQDDRVGIDFRPFLESTGLPRGEGLALFLWGVGVRAVLKKKTRFETDQISRIHHVDYTCTRVNMAVFVGFGSPYRPIRSVLAHLWLYVTGSSPVQLDPSAFCRVYAAKINSSKLASALTLVVTQSPLGTRVRRCGNARPSHPQQFPRGLFTVGPVWDRSPVVR